MYHFNEKLFKNLHSILGMTKAGLSEKLYGNGYQYQRRASNPYGMRFSELTGICNSLRIPVKHFISNEEYDVIFGECSKYVVSQSSFAPIIFRPERIKRVYGNEGLVRGLTRERFARDMNASYAGISGWMNEEQSTVTLEAMLNICNTYSIDLSHFVTDLNAGIPPVGEPSMPETTRRMWQEVTELRNSVSEYRKRIDELMKEIADLKLSAHDGRMLAESGIPFEKENPKVRKWTFDFGLLNSLHKVVGVPKTEMQHSAGIKLYRPEGFGEWLAIRGFVELCNAWKISTHHFFRRGDAGEGLVREYGYYRTENWDPVKFHPEYIADIYGKDSMTGIRLEDIVSSGIASAGDIRGWKKPASTMNIGDMLELCNSLDLTPSCFITDRNRTNLSYRVTMAEFLLEENRLLRRKIMRMKKKKDGKEE